MTAPLWLILSPLTTPTAHKAFYPPLPLVTRQLSATLLDVDTVLIEVSEEPSVSAVMPTGTAYVTKIGIDAYILDLAIALLGQKQENDRRYAPCIHP